MLVIPSVGISWYCVHFSQILPGDCHVGLCPPRNDGGGRQLPLLIQQGNYPTLQKNPPVPRNRGSDDSLVRLNTPSGNQRPVEHAQWSDSTTRPSERICSGPCPVRRADTSDQSSTPNGLIQLPDYQNALAVGPADRPVERAQWSDSTARPSERIVSGDSPLSTYHPGLLRQRRHQRRGRACRPPGTRWSARRRPRRRR